MDASERATAINLSLVADLDNVNGDLFVVDGVDTPRYSPMHNRTTRVHSPQDSGGASLFGHWRRSTRTGQKRKSPQGEPCGLRDVKVAVLEEGKRPLSHRH